LSLQHIIYHDHIKSNQHTPRNREGRNVNSININYGINKSATEVNASFEAGDEADGYEEQGTD
jgi:hypothetical protein